MIDLQAEIAKDLINNTDATIQGILLAVIAVLLTIIWILWKAKLEDEKYIREGDKANLELYLLMTNTVKEVAKTSEENGKSLVTVKDKVSHILNIINERLKDA